MAAEHPLNIVMIGAGLTGLTAAVLLARDGHRVTVLDRDIARPPSAPEAAWSDWQRPGVSQFRQPHLMLPRWRHEVERELPELLEALLADGAARVNLLHRQPESATHGWQPGDEQFDTVTARRPVLEGALSRIADAEPDLAVRRGVRVTGLLFGADEALPHIGGVRTTDGDLRADLVIDAAGRRTPVPDWLGAHGGPAPVVVRASSGFVYYSRHFRSIDGRMPAGCGTVLTHHPSLSVLTLPSDLGTYCLVLVASSGDRALRGLRHSDAWLAAMRCSPPAAPWVAAGEPITEVMPLAGIEDIRRSYVRDGVPVVTGLVALGDAAAATNPSLGRGAAIGILHACVLRDVLAQISRDPYEQVTELDAETSRRVTPWVELSMTFDHHRLTEMTAEVAGIAYRPVDPSWAMTTALLNGAGHDPVLARVSSRIAGLLATPTEVFTDPAVGRRVQPYLAGPRHPSGPTRADFVEAITSVGAVPAWS